MKCPKCHYLGFETGDRCRNCGYDFSLMTPDESAGRDRDLPLREPEPFAGSSNPWMEDLDRGLVTAQSSTVPAGSPDPLAPLLLDTIAPAAAAAAAARADATGRPTPRVATPPLPLFPPLSEGDDQPLVKLPAAPRAPLAVRRTPDKPRLRPVPKPVRRGGAEAAPLEPDPAPILQLADPVGEEPIHRDEPVRVRARAASPMIESSGAGRRSAAMLIDHAMLAGIDVVVIYFTLKMAALTVAEWHLLPPLPLLTFLALVKVVYFYAFTLVGGQTIGKMAAGIRVIAADERGIDPRRAMRRTLAGAASLLTLGLGYLPVFFAADRRALHDRFAHTTVIRS